jgi:predicted TIM-barrel fold metal-dependent hydrolase
MERIDAHIHWNGDHPDWERFLESQDLCLLNVCVAKDSRHLWWDRNRYARERAEENPRRWAWVTTFDLPGTGETDYAGRVIEGLRADLAAGAVGCKIWKNFGMEVKRQDGGWMMVDDPLLQPILSFLEKNDVPLLAHIGEPLACWQPLEPGNPHYDYYSRNPNWHLYGKPGYPTHGEIIGARDRVLQRHPGLRVIGAHLGSLEYDVTEIARRLDLYPNLAVDTSARMKDLAAQDSATVAEFLERYSDRVLWGTDQVCYEAFSGMEPTVREERLERAAQRYQTEWAYYESDQAVTVGNNTVRGLGLSQQTLEKLYRLNALGWYGLADRWG